MGKMGNGDNLSDKMLERMVKCLSTFLDALLDWMEASKASVWNVIQDNSVAE